MSDLERGTGTTSQSQTTANDAALKLLKADVAKLVTALESLATELLGMKASVDRLEKLIREIALGLGVRPQ